jgi:hypothetical protein
MWGGCVVMERCSCGCLLSSSLADQTVSFAPFHQYVNKPMAGHNLMQAIARVNRVFKDKEGGLVVDYVGIAAALKRAMNDYTARDKKNYGDTDVSNAAARLFRG